MRPAFLLSVLALGFHFVAETASAAPPTYLFAAPQASYNVTSSGFTVEFWVKVRAKPGQDPRIIRASTATLGNADPASPDVWQLFVGNVSCCAGQVIFDITRSGVSHERFSGIRIDNGTYHHIAGTYDGSDKMRLFVDGVRRDSISVGAITATISSGSLVVGNANALNNAFDGNIDELRIWQVARSESQIQSSMNTELSSAPGLVASWHLNGNGVDAVASNNLTPVGDVTFVSPGQINQAADICNQSTCPPPPPPVVPPSCSASDASNASVTFTWADVANEDGYRIFRDAAQVGSVGANITTFVDPAPPGTYTYCVEAFNGSGISPQCCDSGTRLVPPPPPTPSPCSASDGGSAAVTVAWANVTGEDGYRIFRNGIQVGSVGANVTSFAEVPATGAGTYTYCVEAFNAGGSSMQCCDSGTSSPVTSAPGIGRFQLAGLLALLGAAGSLAVRRKRQSRS